MFSRTTEAFRAQLAALPKLVQDKAASAYALWAENPHHPSLRFKKVHSNLPIYYVRIDRAWRAVGVLEGDTVVWFWPATKQCCEVYKLRPKPVFERTRRLAASSSGRRWRRAAQLGR